MALAPDRATISKTLAISSRRSPVRAIASRKSLVSTGIEVAKVDVMAKDANVQTFASHVLQAPNSFPTRSWRVLDVFHRSLFQFSERFQSHYVAKARLRPLLTW